MNPVHRLPTILIVEDSDDDFYATQRAFSRADLSNPIRRCRTGDEAMDYLRSIHRDDAPAAEPPLGIILLDLNLPGTDGREILGEIKRDPRLRAIPVVVLTTSVSDEDVRRCYDAGANTYVQKPMYMKDFVDAVARIKDYWFDLALLPRREERAA